MKAVVAEIQVMPPCLCHKGNLKCARCGNKLPFDHATNRLATHCPACGDPTTSALNAKVSP